MAKSDPTGRDIDSLLHEAGARWRERQVFEAVPIAPPAMVRSESGLQRLVSSALGLVAMLAVGAAVVPLRRFNSMESEAACPRQATRLPARRRRRCQRGRWVQLTRKLHGSVWLRR